MCIVSGLGLLEKLLFFYKAVNRQCKLVSLKASPHWATLRGSAATLHGTTVRYPHLNYSAARVSSKCCMSVIRQFFKFIFIFKFIYLPECSTMRS